MKASSDMLGKNSWILQGSMSWAGIHVRQKPVKVVHRGVGELANVPAGSSPARPSCATQSSSFVVFLISGASTKERRDPGNRPATSQGTVRRSEKGFMEERNTFNACATTPSRAEPKHQTGQIIFSCTSMFLV